MKWVVLVLSSFPILTSAHAASFDCKKAATEVEHIICDSPMLSQWDEVMASRYRSLEKTRPDVKTLLSSQKKWLADRNRCNDAACVQHAYHKRFGEFTEIVMHPPDYMASSTSAPEATANVVDPRAMAAEKSKIQEIIKTHVFSLKPTLSGGSAGFCNGFVRNLGNMNGITLIKPDLESQDYANKKWDTYKKNCAEDFLFESYSCELPDAQFIETLSGQKKWQAIKDSCRISRCTKNFTHFTIGDDHSPVDVFYCEDMRGPVNWGGTQMDGSGGYMFAKHGDCSQNNFVRTNDAYSYTYHRPLYNHNGLVKYQGSYYVFDIYESDGDDRIPRKDYFLYVWGRLQPKGDMPRNPLLCFFSNF